MHGLPIHLAKANHKGGLMTENKEIDRLQRRLTREAPAPLTDLSNQMTASVFSLLRALALAVEKGIQ